jgi:hypothetical protein
MARLRDTSLHKAALTHDHTVRIPVNVISHTG